MPEEINTMNEVQALEPVMPKKRPSRAKAPAEVPTIAALNKQIDALRAEVMMKDTKIQMLADRYENQYKELMRLRDARDYTSSRSKAVLGNLTVQLDAIKQAMEIELRTEATSGC